jgi:hypothetical protein
LIFTVVGASANDCVRDHKNADLPPSVPVIGRQTRKIENSSRENQGLLKDWPRCSHYSPSYMRATLNAVIWEIDDVHTIAPR